MSAIVWLASYPKSGNTWVRALLANYLNGGDEPADINQLLGDRGGHAAARAPFDELVGVQASALEPSSIASLRPEAYRQLTRAVGHDVFIKVHDAWMRTDLGEPMFPEDLTRIAVYIVRNPLDVAVSLSHHKGVPFERAVMEVCDGAGEHSTRLSHQLPQFVGSWDRHVRTWLDLSGLPCHVVRYEDLRVDPERTFADLVRACGLSLDWILVRKAVSFSDFAELRRQELAEGFAERPPNARGEFFRKGEVGGWREELPATLAHRVVEANRETMARFGYLEEPRPTEVDIGPGLTSCA